MTCEHAIYPGIGIKRLAEVRGGRGSFGCPNNLVRTRGPRWFDHVIVFNERHLRRLIQSYLTYYHNCRAHLSLGKDSPEPRSVESPDHGKIVEFPMVGGLHHRYRRLAA